MKCRVFIKNDGTLEVNKFNWEGRKTPEETDAELMDRATAKSCYSELPCFDIEESQLPPEVQDGKCGRCRWREDRGAIAIDADKPCLCGRDKQMTLQRTFTNPNATRDELIDALILSEQLKRK